MRTIAFDTETHPFAEGLQFPPIVCGQFAQGQSCAVLDRNDTLDAIEPLLRDDETTIAGHTLPFDFGACCAARPHLVPLVFDKYDKGLVLEVSVRQKLLDIAAGTRSVNEYSLDALSRRYGFGALDKSDEGYRKRFAELDGTPIADWPTRALEYAKQDVLVIGPILRAQEACDYASVLGAEEKRQTAYTWWLKLMTGWGITTDPQGVVAFEAGLREEMSRLGAYLVSEGLLRPDRVLKSGKNKGQIKPGARDTKAAKARMGAFVESLDPEVAKLGGYVTAKGETSLNKKALKEQDDPALVAYADFSSVKKQISTDVPLLSRRTIHSYFDSLKETGRIGSSGPNITNLPRKAGVRECFVPRLGHCFVSADYGGIELYTWAEVCYHLFGYSTLGEELRAGVDPHTQVASDILLSTNPRATYEWCKANKKAVEFERQCGKVLNFGCPGGMGAKRLQFAAANQYDVKLTEEQTAELRAMWWTKRAEMRDYSNHVSRITDRGGVIEHLYSGRVRGGCSYTEACNSYFQGLASDIAKSAGIEISRACYAVETSPLFGARVANFVHDEYIIEVPLGRQHEAAIELARLMTNAAKMWLRHVPPPKVEIDAAMRWSKQVRTLYVNGELVPWTRNDSNGNSYGLVNGKEERLG